MSGRLPLYQSDGWCPLLPTTISVFLLIYISTVKGGARLGAFPVSSSFFSLTYGTWALTDRLMDVLQRCDRRMLRYMAGVTWQDRRSRREVGEMCRVEDLSVNLGKRRLRWFGHVEKAKEGALSEVREMRVGGRRPVGRPRKKWSEVVREDMNVLEIVKDMAEDWEMWRPVIARSTPF